jgi:hypothetical protein
MVANRRPIPILSDDVQWIVEGRRVRQLTLSELFQYELSLRGEADFPGHVIVYEGNFFLDLGPFVPDAVE